jgi:serine/threonine-protein kinase RsbW
MEPLTVPGTVDSLRAIAEYVMTATKQAGLEKKTAYQLRLAVDEIATNIVIHGYQEENLEGELVCQASWDEEAITISLEDTGIPYDPTQAETPHDLDKPLEERQIGGLGVYVARQAVDKLIYERVGNRNRNILVMNRHKFC